MVRESCSKRIAGRGRAAIGLAATALIAGAITSHTTAPIAAQGGQAAPKIRLNRAIERLAQGQQIIGTFPGANMTIEGGRTLATSNLDFVMLDLQYGTFDISKAQQFLLGLINKAAILKKGNLQPDVVPFIRIPVASHDAPQFPVTQLLDIGVYGVMFPDIDTKEEAERAVATMRYPQRNRATVGGPSASSKPTVAAWYWGLPEPEYMQRADIWPINPAGELLTVLQIESAKGVENVEEIMKVPGIGVVFLGPSDMSRTMGEKGPLSPKTEIGVQTVLKACLRTKVPCGYPVTAPDDATAQKELARRKAEGFRMITVNANAGGGGGGPRP